MRPRRDCQIPGDCIHGESPRGGGARRGGGWSIPLPCLLCLWLNDIRRPPPPPGRSAAPPAPSRGGQCGAIVRIAVPWAERGSSASVRSRPQRDDLLPGSVSIEYRPRGGGARRGGGRRRRLPPVSTCHRERYSRRESNPPHRPAAPRPPPAPSRGGRAVWGDSPDSRARGEGEDFGEGDRIEPRICSSCPWHCIYWESPPWGWGSPGWGETETAPPAPVSCVSTRHFFPREVEPPPPLQSLRSGVSQKGARRCRHPESVHGGAASTPDAGGSLENRCSRRISNYFN